MNRNKGTLQGRRSVGPKAIEDFGVMDFIISIKDQDVNFHKYDLDDMLADEIGRDIVEDGNELVYRCPECGGKITATALLSAGRKNLLNDVRCHLMDNCDSYYCEAGEGGVK